MTAQTIQPTIRRLYRDLPNLGTIAIEQEFWADPAVTVITHGNSSIRVAVFNKRSDLVDQFKFPINTKISTIAEHICKLHATHPLMQ